MDIDYFRKKEEIATAFLLCHDDIEEIFENFIKGELDQFGSWDLIYDAVMEISGHEQRCRKKCRKISIADDI